MRKMVTVVTPGEPDREIEADVYYELTVVCVVAGYQVERFIRADVLKELEPETVSVEGVSYIRYKGEGGEYVEFLKNAIVFRSLSYIEIPVPEKPSQREIERAVADEHDAQETVR